MFKKSLCKFFFLFSICANIYLFSDNYISVPKVANEEELLFLRRVVEFWDESNFDLVKKEITTYLSKNKKSHLKSYLNALIGDIFMQEELFNKALFHYKNIDKDEILDKVYINFLQCLFEEKQYFDLATEAEKYLLKNKDIDDKEIVDGLNFFLGKAYFNLGKNTSNEKLREDLITKATPYFTRLISTEYENEALESLCDIHQLNKEYEKASNVYLQLAKNEPSKKDACFFGAAKMQSFYDKELALNTFETIILKKVEKSSDAAFCKLILLYELKNYDKIIAIQEELNEQISNEKNILLKFFIAKSFYHIKKFEKAINYLKETIKETKLEKKYLQNALTTILDAAEKTNDLILFNTTLKKYESEFKNNDLLSKAHLIKAVLYKNNNLFKEALESFEELFEKYPKLKSDEIAYFEYADLLFRKKDFFKSRSSFLTFVKKFENSKHLSAAWNFFLTSSLKLSYETENISEIQPKQKLIDDATYYIKNNTVLNESDKNNCYHILGQANYELSHYQEALRHLLKLIHDDPKNIDIASIYSIAALCFKNTNNYSHFCNYARKALSLNPDLPNKKSLTIHLYNTYLQLASRDSQNRDDHLENAANYLYETYIFSEDKKEISKDNYTWLCNYYYNVIIDEVETKYSNFLENVTLKEYLDKAILLFKNICSYEMVCKIDDCDDPLLMEENASKYQKLLSFSSIKEQSSILKKLDQMYEKYPDYNWKKQAEIHFNLALFHQLKDKKKAKIFFEKAITKSSKGSYVNSAALLELAKINISLLDKKSINENNREAEEILNTLKNLSLRKRLENEPIHFEAHLEYINFAAKFFERKDRKIEKLKLLKEYQEILINSDDILSNSYEEKRKYLPYKNEIVNRYLNFIDTKIILYQTLIYKNTDKDELKTNMLQAKQTISLLVKQKNICSSYFRKRINKLVTRFEK
jgi:tetratricopeptide (TPR) repeat protein